jgi:hypothetical protein
MTTQKPFRSEVVYVNTMPNSDKVPKEEMLKLESHTRIKSS